MSTRRRKNLVVRMLLVLGVLGGIIDIAFAEEDTYWIGTTGDWFSAENWMYKVPDGSDTAYITNGGTAEITGGSPEAYTLYVGYKNGSLGHVNHTGGVLSSRVIVGFSNFMDVTFGEYNLSGNGVLTGSLEVGNLVKGVFNQTGGTNRAQLVLGENGGTGTYNLSGGSGLLSAGSSYVGKYGPGIFNHTGSTHSAANINLGWHLSCEGTYNLSSTGRVSTTQNQIIGRRGTGIFDQSGGTNTVGESLLIGSDSDGENEGIGTYIISGGTLSAKRLHIGTWGRGHLDIQNASASVTVSENLLFGVNSRFTAVPNSMIQMKGASLDIFSTTPNILLGLNNLSLVFERGADANCTLEVAAEDTGHAGVNFYGNFALDALIVGWADVGHVILVDQRDLMPGNEALYVKELTINEGSYLDLNGLNLYYQTLIYNGGTIYLNGGHLIGFPPEEVTLTVEVEPNDAGIDTVSPAAGQHICYQNWGVELQAEPYTSCPRMYNFDHWEGDVAEPNSPSTYVIMDTDKTVTAVFVPVEPVCGDECHPILQGDLNEDCYINFEDFALYCESWLACTHPDCD